MFSKYVKVSAVLDLRLVEMLVHWAEMCWSTCLCASVVGQEDIGVKREEWERGRGEERRGAGEASGKRIPGHLSR